MKCVRWAHFIIMFWRILQVFIVFIWNKVVRNCEQMKTLFFFYVNRSGSEKLSFIIRYDHFNFSCYKMSHLWPKKSLFWLCILHHRRNGWFHWRYYQRFPVGSLYWPAKFNKPIIAFICKWIGHEMRRKMLRSANYSHLHGVNWNRISGKIRITTKSRWREREKKIII